MYKCLFGPVPSRRLGISLGVDLVPRKVCSLDCVYCEVGKTTKLTLERKEYVSFEKIVAEINDYFDKNPDPDYITFSGSGEPTLNSRIGDVLDFLKDKKPNIPIALLTNGTLLGNKKVRDDIMNTDLVLPSLDAASQKVFDRINRPDKNLKMQEYIEGLVKFSKEFTGKIWLEVLILPGYNDSNEELLKLRNAIKRINPDLIQLNTLDRPGTVSDLRGATEEELKAIIELWQMDNIRIIAKLTQRKDIRSYRKDVESAILETIRRRPCTIDDLTKILGMHVNEINKYLDNMESEGLIEDVMQERGRFIREKKM